LPQIHAIVHGKVQGVSFRFYTQHQAIGLGLAGWVRNLPERKVETVAAGSKEMLDEFVAWLHRGSPGARVTQVDVQWSETAEEFSGFEIRT
jgi:acylphosphatase